MVTSTLISMQAPTSWPFVSPTVPASVTPSGSSYIADSLGVFSVRSNDVSCLLGFGFSIVGNSNTRSRVVDGTNYSIMSSDFGGILSFSSSDPVAIAVPFGLLASFQLILIQGGDGPLTLSGEDGVTVVNRLSQFSSAGKEAVLTLIAKPGYENTYILSGELTTIEEDEEV